MPLGLFPYPEVRVTFGRGALRVEAPWLESRIDASMALPEFGDLGDGGSLPASVTARVLSRLVSSERVLALPYWQTRPRDEGECPPAARAPFPADTDVLGHLVANGLSLVGGAWEWPLEEVLELSRSGEAYDPLALYCAVRRHTLLAQGRLARLGYDVRERLAPLADSHASEGARAEAHSLATRLVHLNREVTRAAPTLLAPAASMEGEPGRLLEIFMRAERGHDAFATSSLRLLTGNLAACALPTPVPALRFLLELLGHCARSHPVALAFVIGAFEGLPHDEAPWTPWDALASLDARHATRGVGAHSEINRRESHADVAFALSRACGPIGTEEACVSVRLAELCARARNAALEEAYSSTGLKIQHSAEEGAKERTVSSKSAGHAPEEGMAHASK